MKIYTIGRGEEADIIIDDELVSRRHATIKVLPFGKMEIRDFSKNGTYVNGIRLSINKPYRVTRKDVVTLANSRQLDWKSVPDPMRPYRICVIAVLALILIAVAYNLISRLDLWNGQTPAGTEIQESQPINPKTTAVDNPVKKPTKDSLDISTKGFKLFPDKKREKNKPTEKEDTVTTTPEQQQTQQQPTEAQVDKDPKEEQQHMYM